MTIIESPPQPARQESALAGGVGLTNARTRLVGNRSGWLAELVVSVVRQGRNARTAVANGWAFITTVVTGLGWATALVAVLGLVLGYVYGWAELVAIGFVAVTLLVVALFYLLGRTAYKIDLRLPDSRVVVGERAPGQLTITNPTRLRIIGASLELPVGDGIAEFPLPSLGPGDEHEELFVVPTHRRGVIPIGPVHSVRADPVGLLRRDVEFTEQKQLFVHPRTVTIPRIGTGFFRDLEGSPTGELANSDLSFHAIREYLPGDDRRHIHWKSTAKTGSYMVRQFEQTKRSHLLVALSLAEDDFASDDEFEMAVSVAGSLSLRAIRDGRSVSVVASSVTPEYAKQKVFDMRTLNTLSRTRMLDDLSLVERHSSALDLRDLSRVASNRLSSVSIAFLLCGSSVNVRELRAASVAFPLGVEVVAVVCNSEARPSLRRGPGLTVLTIGYLDDLQKSLARARR